MLFHLFVLYFVVGRVREMSVFYWIVREKEKKNNEIYIVPLKMTAIRITMTIIIIIIVL